MKKRALLLIILAFGFLAGEPSAWAAGTPGAPKNLRNQLTGRLAVDSYYRDDLLSVLSRTRSSTPSGARNHYLRGETLKSLGLYQRAAEAFRHALAEKPDTSGWWTRALSGYMEMHLLIPDLDPPVVPPERDIKISGDAALYFGTYLLVKRDYKRGLKILSASPKATSGDSSLFFVTKARHEASLGQWNRSIRTLQSYRVSGSSELTDLVYLQRGFSYMESDEFNRARDSFLRIPPKSPFAAQALHGLSWAMIRKGDLVGASVRLSELIEKYEDSSTARKAVIDLALCYRDLGLFDRAGKVLLNEAKYLNQVRRWAVSLKASDLGPGKDLAAMLSGTHTEQPLDPEILGRNPGFIKQWISKIAHDRQLKRYSSLIEGADRLSDAGKRLVSKYKRVILLLELKLERNNNRQIAAKKVAEDLNDVLVRLPALQNKFLRTINESPLARFADENTLKLAERTRKLKDRIRSLEDSAGRADSFTGVINRIKDSRPATQRERHLNSVRESAYKELMAIRPEIREIYSSSDSLEGKIWLGVKKGVADSYTKNQDTIDSRMDQTRASIGKSLSVQELLARNENSLINSIEKAKKTVASIESLLSRDLQSLRSRMITARTRRILYLAGSYARELQGGQARALYTAADIETTHMETRLKAMQEALD